jgi:hypothetical protein
MIYIFGDSHAKFSFRDLNLPHLNCYEVSITMHRIGRDQWIPNFNNSKHTKDDILIFAFGEVDCRCHISRQIMAGRDENEIMNELVQKYFDAIRKNITTFKAIIITGIIPPTERNDYESRYGPITHEFPFVGTDEERVRFTERMNYLIRDHCQGSGFYYFYPYQNYKRDNGCLKYELSDLCVHIGQNSHVLQELDTLIQKI